MSHGAYTIRDVAMILKVSEKTVYRMIKDQELPHIRVRKQIRIAADALEDYLRGEGGDGQTSKGKPLYKE